MLCKCPTETRAKGAFIKADAYTLIDLLVGVACLALILAVVLVLPFHSRPNRGRAKRINCICNLKQIGLSYKQWAIDNHDLYPMQVSVTNGGTMEFMSSGAVWVHFRVLSNELNTPKVLLCPSDDARRDSMATTFGTAAQPYVPFTNDNNVSYFVGVDATETNATMFLTGDRNLTNSLGHNRRLVNFPTNQPAGWTHELHNHGGNVGLVDGSVQQFTTSRARAALIESGVATNRLAMP
jgi:hypothetical protein